MRSHLAHKYPEGKIADTLNEALDALLKKFEPKPIRAISEKEELRSLDTRYIPRGIRNEVWERDGGQCSFVSPSGKRCSAKRFLQLDHIEPWALGGSSHEAMNLRLLCSEHNRPRARSTFKNFWQARTESQISMHQELLRRGVGV